MLRGFFVRADDDYMMQAIDLAKRAEGFTSPNPMVGCVLVKNGAVIAEGWHHGPGEPHAETAALAAAGEAARGATVYLTLEPCNHHGRTPPCADALIEAGVAEVVYAISDPNPVASGGARRLEAAGVKVRSGVCQSAAQELIRFWRHAITSKRPYVVAKFAMSLDGKIATKTGESQWITAPPARARGHDLRQAVDAIIVGANTVIADDPSLTARPVGRDGANPLRIILDSTGRTSPGAQMFDRAEPGALLVTTGAAPTLRLDAYRNHGVETLTLPADETGRPDLDALLAQLYARDIHSVMVEGGSQALGSFFDAGLVDEVWAFVAPVIIGGEAGSPVGGLGIASLTDAYRLNDPKIEQVGRDVLVRGRLTDREVR